MLQHSSTAVITRFSPLDMSVMMPSALWTCFYITSDNLLPKKMWIITAIKIIEN